MKRKPLLVSAVVAASALTAWLYSPSPTLGADAGGGGADGKAVFLAQKCDACHSMGSLAIVQKLKGSKAPDLSNVGSARDAAWIEKWLNKEIELHGKKHMKTFSGTDAERTTVAQWLATQKDAKYPAPAN